MSIQRQMAAMIAKIAATITKAKPKLRLLVTTAEGHAPHRITPIMMNTAVRRICGFSYIKHLFGYC